MLGCLLVLCGMGFFVLWKLRSVFLAASTEKFRGFRPLIKAPRASGLRSSERFGFGASGFQGSNLGGPQCMDFNGLLAGFRRPSSHSLCSLQASLPVRANWRSFWQSAGEECRCSRSSMPATGEHLVDHLVWHGSSFARATRRSTTQMELQQFHAAETGASTV